MLVSGWLPNAHCLMTVQLTSVVEQIPKAVHIGPAMHGMVTVR